MRFKLGIHTLRQQQKSCPWRDVFSSINCYLLLPPVKTTDSIYPNHPGTPHPTWNPHHGTARLWFQKSATWVSSGNVTFSILCLIVCPYHTTMPLFRDPDRRRHYLWSPDHGNGEQPTTGSSQLQLNDLSHIEGEVAAPEMTTNSMHSTALNPPKSWANDREELIHRIKESSPWRLQHMVCESLRGCLALFQISARCDSAFFICPTHA